MGYCVCMGVFEFSLVVWDLLKMNGNIVNDKLCHYIITTSHQHVKERFPMFCFVFRLIGSGRSNWTLKYQVLFFLHW